MLKRSVAPAALVLTASLLLAGCGGGDSTPAAQPGGADAATGELVTGDGYTFNAPEGWGVPDQEVPGFTPDVMIANLGDTDGFADNMNVVLSPAGEVTVEQAEQSVVSELEAAGYADVEVNDRATIGGDESAHITAALSQGTTSMVMDQFYVSHSGQTYVVTFSTNDSTPADDRAAVYEPVLASWAWE
ncbi:hypothetical protein [Microbacterium sp.]|uniref:hypothetical protein n=1 Tax=Microbacterium sp. TaxID=51671 RepID=UPI003A8844B3